MDLSLPQVQDMLKTQFDAKNWDTVQQIATQVVDQAPQESWGWRYLGIAKLILGHDPDRFLHTASMLGDGEAKLWQQAKIEFSPYAWRDVTWLDYLTQIHIIKLRQSPYMDYPFEVHIETFAMCNAACCFCPYPDLDRKGEKMSEDLISKIIDDLKQIPRDVPFTISPFKVNDPFLDKRVVGVCQKINRELPHAALRLFTNGTPITDKLLDELETLSNVSHIWVSLNESEPEAYRRVMQLPFEKTVQKLDILHRRLQAGYPHRVVVSRVGDRTEADQTFLQFLRMRYPLFTPQLMVREDWIGQVDRPEHPPIPARACVHWFELSIMATGKVALCCMDGKGEWVVGDVGQQSVLEVYNAPQFKKMRQYSTTRQAAMSPCDGCAH